jgi:hypothetical protein
MLIKTAVVEEAKLCEKCHRYHAASVDCSNYKITLADDKSINNIDFTDPKATKEDFDEK